MNQPSSRSRSLSSLSTAAGAAASQSSSRTTSTRAKRRRWLAVAGVSVLLLAGASLFFFTELEWQDVHAAMTAMNPAALITLMAALPVFGFSIGIVYLVAGVKFGPILGGIVVVGVTAVHLLATHAISRSLLRRPLERVLARRNYHLPEIPQGENVAIAAMAALVPGLPYFARNYLLALSGVPLRVYFWVCLPIYVARSYLVIFLGDMSGALSGQRLLILGAFYALKLGICGYLILRIRRHYKLTHPTGR